MVGARCACPISGAKLRAPTIETIGRLTFYEIIKVKFILKYVSEYPSRAKTIDFSVFSLSDSEGCGSNSTELKGNLKKSFHFSIHAKIIRV